MQFMHGRRKIWLKKLLDIDGGVAPIVIALVKIGGTAFIAGAGWRLGEEIYDGVKGLFD